MDLAGSYQALEKATVLVVDDNSQALEIVASVLMSFGVRNILRASSGEEAQEVVRRQVVDLILTDAQMPGLDGYDFVRWLRREGPRGHAGDPRPDRHRPHPPFGSPAGA